MPTPDLTRELERLWLPPAPPTLPTRPLPRTESGERLDRWLRALLEEPHEQRPSRMPPPPPQGRWEQEKR